MSEISSPPAEYSQGEQSQTEGLYQALIEALDFSLCRWLPDTTLTFANDKYRRIFGLADNVVGQQWITFLPEAERKTIIEFNQDLVKNPRTVTNEHWVTLEDGRQRFYQWVDTPILDENGQVTEFQSVGYDITEQKETEIALRESEQKLLSVIEGTGATITLLDLQGTVLYINHEIPGVNKDDFIGSTVYNWLTPEMAELIKKNIAQVVEGKTAVGYENVIPGPTGQMVYLYNLMSPMFNGDEVFGISIITNDVTAQKQLEIEVRKQKEELEHFHSLVSEIQDYAILSLDAKGNIESWNKGAEKIKGYKTEEIIGKSFKLFYPEADRKNGKPDNLLRLAKKEGRAQDEGWRQKKDGRLFWANVTITALFNEKGEVTGYSKVTRDLTKTRQTAEALRLSEEKYRTLYEDAPVMHINVNPSDAKIKDCNRLVVERLGYGSKEELIGQPIFALYHEDCLEEVKTAFHQFASTGQVKDTELILKHKDGSKIPVILNVSAVRDENGKIIRSSSTWVEITELKKTQEELKTKNKELEQFVYITSHDLQEPLRTVTSFAELIQLEHQSQLNDEADLYLQYISESAARMRALIKGLLDYSRIGRQREDAFIESHIILESIFADLKLYIAENEATFEVGDLPNLNGNKTELRMLFQNLISNAIKFRKEGTPPRIKITAKKAGSHWQFAVKDNGIGIDDSYKGKIFLIFQRLHTNQEYEGTGIGLAHCKKIVELHGGKIWVESEPNKGSTFYFTLLAK